MAKKNVFNGMQLARPYLLALLFFSICTGMQVYGENGHRRFALEEIAKIIVTAETGGSVDEHVASVSVKDCPDSHSPLSDRTGKKFEVVTKDGWKIAFTDALPSYDSRTGEGSIDCFNHSHICITAPDHCRYQSITWSRFTESGNSFIYSDTGNGRLAKPYATDATGVAGTTGREGNGMAANATWTPTYAETENSVTFTVLGKSRSEKGRVKLEGDIGIDYVSSNDFPAKQTPTLKVEFDTLTITINQNKVTEPTVVVYDKEGNRISNKFTLNFTIADEPVQSVNVDTPTGSRVTMSDGEISTGNNRGTFRIIITACPKNAAAAAVYNMATSHYTVNVTGRRATVEINGNATEDDPDRPYVLHLIQNVAVKAPVYKIRNANGEDISKFYEMDYSKIETEALETENIDPEHPVVSIDPATHAMEGLNPGVAKTKIRFRVKDEYKHDYDDATFYLTTMVEIPDGNVGAQIIFESRELEQRSSDEEEKIYFKRNSSYFNELIIKIYDKYMNDITDFYQLDPQKLVYRCTSHTGMTMRRMTKAEVDRNNALYKDDPDYNVARVGDPIFSTTSQTGTETMTIQILPKQADALFNTVSRTIPIVIEANRPDVAFTPAKLVLKKGSTWRSGNATSPFGLKVYQDIRSNRQEYNYYNVNIPSRSADGGVSVSGRAVGYDLPKSSIATYPFTITANTTGLHVLKVTVTPGSGYWGTGASNFDAVTVDWPVEVVDKIIPTATFAETGVVCKYGQTFVEPKLNITDANGTDISDKYTVRFNAKATTGALQGQDNSRYIFKNVSGYSGNYYSTDGKINTEPQYNEYFGTYTITATLTPKNAADYEGTTTTYELTIYNSDWGYRLIKTAGNLYGKVKFSASGSMYGGSTINSVPGLSITIGQKGQNDWSVESDKTNAFELADGTPAIDSEGRCFATGAVVEFDKTKTMQILVTDKADNSKTVTEEVYYLPTGGTFYRLTPAVNGFLTVDAQWVKHHEYVLMDIDGNNIYRETYTPTENRTGEYRFRNPIRSTDAVYLYDFSSGSAGGLKVYGFNFTPAFVTEQSNVSEDLSATAYLNFRTDAGGNEVKVTQTAGLPKLLHQTSEYVSNSVENGYDDYFSVGDDGRFNLLKTTDGSTLAGDSHYAVQVKAHQGRTFIDGKEATATVPDDHVRTFAKVMSPEDPTVYKLPYFDMCIRGIHTYMVPAGYTPEVQEHVTEVPGITMIWGGWNRADLIKYQRDQHEIQDSWREAIIDKYSDNTETIDGLLFASNMGGDSNPKDELNEVFGTETSRNKGTFNLPCRGNYIEFRPTKAGRLYAYVVQKGCVEWNGVDHVNPGRNNVVRWRPLFIVDEHGRGVELARNPNKDDRSGTGAAIGAYTESKFRCEYKEGAYVEGVATNLEQSSDGSAFYYDYQQSGYTPKAPLTEERMAFIQNAWRNNRRGDFQNVIPTDNLPGMEGKGGHLLISKGYVCYSFDVKPGKSYFIFQTGSKMGFAGFSFDAQNDNCKDIVLKRSEKLSASLKGKYETGKDNHANVTLECKLTPRQYNAIVLPFSLNAQQVTETFGIGSSVVYFDDVVSDTDSSEDGSTDGHTNIRFVEHYHQMIVAGDPCLVWPTFEGVASDRYATDAAGRIVSIRINDVCIDRSTDSDIRGIDSKDGKWTYTGTFTGSKADAGVGIPEGSYFVSGGNLYRAKAGGQTTAAYFSWLKADGKAPSAPLGMGFRNFLGTDIGTEGTINAIANLPAELTPADTPTTGKGIYDLRGRRISTDTRTTEALPKGIYIVNGKKITIK